MAAKPSIRFRLPDHVLPRPRLLKQLEASEARVLACIAPAGYGKTTLLSQFATQTERPVAWLTLDDSATDPLALAQELAHALQKAFPRAKFLTWKTAQNLGAMPPALAAALREDVNRLQRNALVVFDRIERLSLESARWLELWLDGLLDGHQVCVAGYADSAFSVARYVADGAVLLEAKDLAFTPQETANYLKARGFEGNTFAVYQALEGWAVGLALAATQSGSSIDPKSLMLEVLKRLPPAVRLHLPEAAVLEVWDEQTALQIGCKLPKGWLTAALKAGLPLVAAGRGQYRPHTVLLEALTEELKLLPKQFSSLHAKVGEMAEVAGNHVLALQHYHLAGIETNIIRVLNQLVPHWSIRREYKIMRKSLELLLPEQMNLDLQVYFGQGLYETAETTHGEKFFLSLLEAGHSNPIVYVYMSRVAYNNGDGHKALGYAEEGLRQLTSEHTVDTVRLLVMKSSAYQILGEPEKDLEAAKKAVTIAEEINDLSALGMAFSLIAPSYGDLGDKVTCEQTFYRSIEISQQLGTPIRLLQDYNNFASYLGDWGRVEEALQMADMGVPIARREDSVFLPILLGTRGLQQWRLGNLELANQDLEEAISLCPTFALDYMENMFHFFLVQVELFSQKYGAAEHRLLDLKTKSQNTDELAFLEGLLAFSVGDLQAARGFFEAVGKQVSVWDAPRKLMYLAEIARLEGRLEFSMIETIIQQLETLGHQRPLLLDAQFLHGLYQTCLENNWYPEIFANALKPQNQSDILQVPLELHLFGKAQWLLAGETLKLGLAKTKELLAWLVLHGASTRAELLQGIWGQSNKTNIEYFKVALRKLRMAFSDHNSITFEPILFEDGVYKLHPRLQIACSAAEFFKAQEHFPTNPDVLESMFSSYRGQFLSGIESKWVQELQRVFLELVVQVGERLGQHLIVTDKYRALRIFRRVLEFDPLSEIAKNAA